jgi:hypothetical protein
MTATWTIDDNDDLEGPVLHAPSGQIFDLEEAEWDGWETEDFAALVADVRAARLADDLAAVIRRFGDGWRMGERMVVVEAGSPRPPSERIWMHNTRESEPMSPGEVAALHHAHQEDA